MLWGELGNGDEQGTDDDDPCNGGVFLGDFDVRGDSVGGVTSGDIFCESCCGDWSWVLLLLGTMATADSCCVTGLSTALFARASINSVQKRSESQSPFPLVSPPRRHFSNTPLHIASYRHQYRQCS